LLWAELIDESQQGSLVDAYQATAGVPAERCHIQAVLGRVYEGAMWSRAEELHVHDAAHDAFITLPAYTGTRENMGSRPYQEQEPANKEVNFRG